MADILRPLKASIKLLALMIIVFGFSVPASLLLLMAGPWRNGLGAFMMRLMAQAVFMVLGAKITIDAPLRRPKIIRWGGLILANHLSFLDIPLLSALFGARFVSKYEVLWWPGLGPFAYLAGNLFLKRDRMGHRLALLRYLAVASSDRLIAIFPQGTVAASSRMLPFQRGLFKVVQINPALRMLPVTLDYGFGDHLAWENQNLLTNALRICGLDDLHIRVIVHPTVGINDYADASAAQIAKRVEQTVLAPLSPKSKTVS